MPGWSEVVLVVVKFDGGHIVAVECLLHYTGRKVSWSFLLIQFLCFESKSIVLKWSSKICRYSEQNSQPDVL